MRTPTVTKEFQFDAAHMLTGHKGLCQNLHGHTYRVEVTVGGNQLQREGPAAGMLVDFKDLKEWCNNLLFKELDHAYIYNEDADNCELEQELAHLLETHGKKTYAMCGRPTAENMCTYFASILDSGLQSLTTRNIWLERLKIWETPTSYAEVVL